MWRQNRYLNVTTTQHIPTFTTGVLTTCPLLEKTPKSFTVQISLKSTKRSPLTLWDSCVCLAYVEVTGPCGMSGVSHAMLLLTMPGISPTMEKLGHLTVKVDILGTMTLHSVNPGRTNINRSETWKAKNIYSNINCHYNSYSWIFFIFFFNIYLVCFSLGFGKHNTVLVFLQWLMHVHIVEVISSNKCSKQLCNTTSWLIHEACCLQMRPQITYTKGISSESLLVPDNLYTKMHMFICFILQLVLYQTISRWVR